MAVKLTHALSQGPVIAALLKTGVGALKARPTAAPSLPGPTLHATVPPRSRALIHDYVRWAGGDPRSYRDHVPAHLFPQWGFPLLAQTLSSVPYNLTSVVNAGCRIELNAPLPANEPLKLAASLQSIDDDGRRAILEQRLVTGTASVPNAIVSTMNAFVPLKRKDGDKRTTKRERPRVPESARAIGSRRLGATAGRDFALLTGDINPIHWIGPYARAAGFKNTILHGFGTLAISVEMLNRVVFSGDVSHLRSVEARFTKPLVLPGSLTIFVSDDGGLFAGTHPGGPAFMTGSYTHD